MNKKQLEEFKDYALKIKCNRDGYSRAWIIEALVKKVTELTKNNIALDALKILRDLAEFQNGAPLVRYEKEYNKTMAEVWDFLEANEPE